MDSEKITINMGTVDLGHIDLMVEDGFYANRTDFIRTAIRNQLEHENDTNQTITRKAMAVGALHYNAADLEKASPPGTSCRSQSSACCPSATAPHPTWPARPSNPSPSAAFRASQAVKDALADRIH